MSREVFHSEATSADLEVRVRRLEERVARLEELLRRLAPASPERSDAPGDNR